MKGDIARALFYMAVRYEGDEPGSVDLELSDTPSLTQGVRGKLSVPQKWHQFDPVSEEGKNA
ncbi:MAG: endonuclease [Akkermansiaceae bacterium]|nr:endonuclease [Akkermansiaceae bacterium]